MIFSKKLIKMKYFKSLSEFYIDLKTTVESLVLTFILPLILIPLGASYLNLPVFEGISLILLSIITVLNFKQFVVLLYYCYIELRICLISFKVRYLKYEYKDNRELLIDSIFSIEADKPFEEVPLLKDVLIKNLDKLKIHSINMFEELSIENIKADNIELEYEALKSLNQRIKNSTIFSARPKVRERIVLLENALVKAKEANTKFENLGPFSQSLYRHDDIVPAISKDLESLKELLKFVDKACNKLVKFKQLKSEELVKRLELAEKYAIEYVGNTVKEINYNDYDNLKFDNDGLKTSYLAMSIGCGVSVAADLYNTGQVYDALREVSGNYEGMSDAETWFETLFMSSASLQGLENLTKGRYFENLVAEDTGGTLFENFNHPDTDMLLSGEAVQLKATSSEAYINSIDDDITVIATSEVSLNTGAIDSGYSNEELSETVELAFGGIVDFGDAALHGLGGLGIFASLQGFNLFFKRLDEKVEVDIAMVEGLELAFEKTVQGTAAAADIVYKVGTAKSTVNIFTFLFKATYWILAKTTNLIIAILDRIFK